MEKLKALRTARSVSLRELSKASGISKDTLWRLESGRGKRPYPSTIRKIAEALGVQPADIQK